MHGAGSAVSFGYCKNTSHEQILSKTQFRQGTKGYPNKKCHKLQQDTGRHNEDAPEHVRRTPLGDPQETPGEDQEAPRNTAGHPKASQMIPRRVSGASQKPLWKDVSFMSWSQWTYESIANSIQNGPCCDAEDPQTTHRRLKGILETAINPKKPPGNDQVASSTTQTAPKRPYHAPRTT